MDKGLAEQLGARDPKGRGFGLSKADIGTDVTGYLLTELEEEERRREKLPPGHRYFRDCERETWARLIRWSMTVAGAESWFATLTFKDFVSVDQSHRLLNRWLSALCDAYECFTGARGLRWVIAQEWQKRDVIHFHVILSGVRLNFLSRKRWESRWQGVSGGFASIYPARAKAAPYLAKYAGKAQGGAMRQGGTWRGITPPRSTRCCQT